MILRISELTLVVKRKQMIGYQGAIPRLELLHGRRTGQCYGNPRCRCRCHDDEKETIFMSVDMPGFFREIEVHRNREDPSSLEREQIRDLEKTRHGVSVPMLRSRIIGAGSQENRKNWRKSGNSPTENPAENPGENPGLTIP